MKMRYDVFRKLWGWFIGQQHTYSVRKNYSCAVNFRPNIYSRQADFLHSQLLTTWLQAHVHFNLSTMKYWKRQNLKMFNIHNSFMIANRNGHILTFQKKVSSHLKIVVMADKHIDYVTNFQPYLSTLITNELF